MNIKDFSKKYMEEFAEEAFSRTLRENPGAFEKLINGSLYMEVYCTKDGIIKTSVVSPFDYREQCQSTPPAVPHNEPEDAPKPQAE